MKSGLMLFAVATGLLAALVAFFMGFSIGRIALAYSVAGMFAMLIGAISVVLADKLKSRKRDR
ncbi:hypothetical protein [Celeribacter ethanolicus]|uniref:hypothetical protein n=1 Tax=Celeribacter ethanolicus TaxID=1758178 RepID=UPI0012FD7999|nr:hypothetical protein [Celeribacter ethanolicus]